MKIEITAEEFREEFKKVRGVEPTEDMIRFALAYNEMLNKAEVAK